MTDELWQVVVDTMRKYKGLNPNAECRRIVESTLEITEFDGGAFVANGAEFDLFVVPEKRGKWPMRKLINGYVDGIKKKFGKAIVRIDYRNSKSLRLALGFGFRPVGFDGTVIKLEA